MNKKSKEDEKDIISDRVIQYIDDPKESSALAKIKEMSKKAIRKQSPTQTRHMKYMKEVDELKSGNVKDIRRKTHFATVKNPEFVNFGRKLKDYESKKNNDNNNTGKDVKYKSVFTWDKTKNRLIEKKVPVDQDNEGKNGKNNQNEIIEEDKEKEDIIKFYY